MGSYPLIFLETIEKKEVLAKKWIDKEPFVLQTFCLELPSQYKEIPVISYF